MTEINDVRINIKQESISRLCSKIGPFTQQFLLKRVMIKLTKQNALTHYYDAVSPELIDFMKKHINQVQIHGRLRGLHKALK